MLDSVGFVDVAQEGWRIRYVISRDRILVMEARVHPARADRVSSTSFRYPSTCSVSRGSFPTSLMTDPGSGSSLILLRCMIWCHRYSIGPVILIFRRYGMGNRLLASASPLASQSGRGAAGDCPPAVVHDEAEEDRMSRDSAVEARKPACSAGETQGDNSGSGSRARGDA